MRNPFEPNEEELPPCDIYLAAELEEQVREDQYESEDDDD